jgi:hypothetical protein
VSAAVAYPDGSAAVKLVHRERETPALVGALGLLDTRVSSELFAMRDVVGEYHGGAFF